MCIPPARAKPVRSPPVFYVIFSLLGGYVEVEVHTPTGRVHMVMKRKRAEGVLKQINLKDYTSKFALSRLPIVNEGINFDSCRRTISDRKIAPSKKQITVLFSTDIPP